MKPSRVAAGALLCACVSTAAFAQKPSKADQKAVQAAAQAQQQEYDAVIRLADTAMSGQTAPSDFPIQFQNDFLRSAGGRVWVPITLTLDPAKLPSMALTLYMRAAPRGTTTPPPPAPAGKNDKDKDKNKKNDKNAPAAAPNYPYDDIAVLDLKSAPAGQPIRIMRGVSIPSGSYDFYVVLHERSATGPGKASVLKQALDVPNYTTDFSSSSVLLAKRVDQLPAALPPEQQTERPYAFGSNEIIIAPDHKFAKAEELLVLVQVYNPSVSADKKFNLEATYTFFRQEPGAEKRFNNTEPQLITSESAPGVDPTGPAGVPAGLGIPLQTFPEGNYRLEIKITDKLNAKVITQSVNFTVAP